MDEWEKQLQEYNLLLKKIVQKFQKKEGELRFNRPVASASDIAEQYFCEKKVEMQFIHGEIETERKTLGIEAHKNLLKDVIKTSREKLWQDIYEKDMVIALEIPLLADYNDLILAGSPDAVLFQHGVPLVIFEYKFSKMFRPFINHHVQARTYGILLTKMGFNTSKLFYAIVIADPKAKEDTNLKEKVVHSVFVNGLKKTILYINNARIYVNKFNRKEAEQNLNWAIDFWKKKREAIPTNNPNKCKSCEYNLKCDQRPHAY
jgi:hypothetical protein